MQVAFTWDGTLGGPASAAHLYINGIEQAKVTAQNGSDIHYQGATNQPLQIGSAWRFLPGSLNGKMAYMAVYKGRTLTPAELNQLDAQLPITTESAVTGTLSTNGPATTMQTTINGQTVKLGFVGAASQQATVQFSGNTLGAVTAALIKPDGSSLASTSSSASSFTLGPVTLPIAGGYRVVVTPGPNATGNINVALQLTNVLTPVRQYGVSVDNSNALSTNLVGLFLMNEGSGITTKNTVDNQTANLLGATPAHWNTTDPSIVFEGAGASNSYVDAGTDLAFDQLPTQKMTVVTKVWVNAVQPAGIVQKADLFQSGFAFSWDASGALQLKVLGFFNMVAATAGNVIVPGQWVQVAFTWDGTQGGLASAAHFYVNGIEQTILTAQNGRDMQYTGATNQPFLIGEAPSYYAGSLNGKMAYMAVYKGRILTPTELNQLDAQLPIH
jgi:hypothetical protein